MHEKTIKMKKNELEPNPKVTKIRVFLFAGNLLYSEAIGFDIIIDPFGILFLIIILKII